MSDEFNPWWVKKPAATQLKPKTASKKCKSPSLTDLISAGKVKQIEKLVRTSQLSPNQEFSFDDSRKHALFPMAIERGWKSLALQLIHSGADVNRYSVTSTPLMLACADRNQASDEIIDALLKAGAKLELRTKRLEDSGDETALMLAARQRYLSAVKLLIEAGANPGAQTRFGKTAIHYALMSERPDKSLPKVIEILRAAGCPLLGTELHMLVFRRDVQTTEFLLRKGCPFDVLLPHGSRVGAGPAKGETPLTVTCKMSTSDLVADLLESTHRNIPKQREKIVQLLLDAGANPNQTNARAETPLSLAIKDKAAKIANLLRQAGAKS
jgi:ankyrin repeat protein